MTNTDLIIEFDLLYNNALSGSAPNLNNYEKSLFLTQAQEDIIRDSYEDRVLKIGYEQSEKIRRRLEELTVAVNTAFDSTFDTSLATLKIDANSKFFKLSTDVWYITFEQARTASTRFKITPIGHDEYSNLSENPFKEPNKRKAWRLDVKNTIDTNKVVEIISDQTLTSYYHRYLKQPTPVVLVDLTTGEFAGSGLTIDGITAVTESILPNEVRRLLLRRAVDLATVAYKENTLQNNVQINN